MGWTSTTLIIIGAVLVVGAIVIAIASGTSSTHNNTFSPAAEGAPSTAPKWIATVVAITGLLSGFAGLAKELQDDGVDCVPYVNSLVGIAAKVNEPTKLSSADLSDLYGDDIADSCGAPQDFVDGINPAGWSPPPPTSSP